MFLFQEFHNLLLQRGETPNTVCSMFIVVCFCVTLAAQDFDLSFTLTSMEALRKRQGFIEEG